jgi:acetyl esterase/lipase
MRTVPLFLLALAFAGTAQAAEVEVVKDLAYFEGKDADPVRHKLDLYLPKGQKDFPVLLYIHGGGWRNGSKDRAEKVGMTFAGHGIGTVVANYRLTPQVKHPGHIQDVARAFAWTHKNIAKHGGKPDQIFISGHSAGGQLVALLATDESHLKAEGLGLANIKGSIPISGPYQLNAARLQEVFGDEASCRQASPLTHLKGNHPPFLLLYAEKDIPNCEEMSRAMTEGLRGVKGQADHQLFKGRDHGTIVSMISEPNDPVAQAMLAFIAKHSGLKAKPGN